MGVREIINIDTVENKAFLQTKTKIVDREDWKTGKIKSLCRTLNDTLERMGGLGLSANQIKEDNRVFVVDWRRFPMYKGLRPRCFVNPELVYKSEDWKEAREGCLSIPDLYCLVKRSTKVTISFLNHVGKRQEITAEGLLANVFQHEVDHLDGILMTDREKQQEDKRANKNISVIRPNVESRIVQE